MQYTRRVGRPEFVHPEKRRQRQSLIALLNYLWCSFRENGARLLVVLGNEKKRL